MFIVYHINILYNHKSFLQQNILEYYFVSENVRPILYDELCQNKTVPTVNKTLNCVHHAGF